MNVITYSLFDNEGRRLAVVRREGFCRVVFVRPGLLDTSTVDGSTDIDSGQLEHVWQTLNNVPRLEAVI
jgi:hypothetical protein